MSIIVINRLVKKGRRWPHKHKWIPLREHPRGPDVIVSFMMEDDEPDLVEMCSTCSGRRWKPLAHKNRYNVDYGLIIDDLTCDGKDPKGCCKGSTK